MMAEDKTEEQEPTQEDEMMTAVQAASKVQTTLGTPGWTEIIEPALKARRDYYMSALLSRQEKMEDVTFAQQSVLAIDELLSLIQNVGAEGENAQQYFKTKPKEETE